MTASPAIKTKDTRRRGLRNSGAQGPIRTSGSFRAPEISPAILALSYTEEDWESDSYDLYAERSDPAPCPDCGRTGFFGPRAQDPGLKFRACRFCGFTQEVDHAPVRYLPTAHDCDEWPTCAKAPYLWWVPPDVTEYHCPYCGQQVHVFGVNMYHPGAIQTAPQEDKEHPWWRVPQGRPYKYYLRFWENWPVTKGRVFL